MAIGLKTVWTLRIAPRHQSTVHGLTTRMNSNTDSEVLYLSERPEKPIVTHISVPPIAIRPSADWEAIQAEVAQYVNSDVRGVPFSLQVARPLSGFVEYTGTTVISPDPNLRVT
ncbi:hypothetical protein WN943_001486 [Citrus x changshan-huyou]